MNLPTFEAFSVSARAQGICRGETAVSADMALRLGRLFGTTPEFWINLQAQYDLEVAERAAGKAIAKAVVPLAV